MSQSDQCIPAVWDLPNHCTGAPDTHWVQLISQSIRLNDIIKPQWDWPLNFDLIDLALKQGPLIVNACLDPINHHENHVVDELLKITNNFVVLSGDATYFMQPKKHICFFPFWYLSQKLNNAPESTSGNQRSYKVSSLNGRPRYHRIENFIKLREKPYFNKILVSMHNSFDMRNEKRETPLEFWNKDIVKQFELLLTSTELQEGHTNDHSTIHPAYTDSYVNYVTETSIVDGLIFSSEKTWKPVRAGQFAIWLSNPGHVKFLRSIGFDVFDDIIDHSYDDERNLHHRIDMIHNLLDHVMSMDLAQIFQDTLARRQSNIDRFYSDDLEQLLTTQCNKYRL